jgi:hypothetical protein
VQLRIVPAVLATSLAVFIALPGVADETVMADSARPTTTLPHQRDGLLRGLTLIGPAVAIGVLAILGLTIGRSAPRRYMLRRRSAGRRQERTEQFRH